MSRCSTIAGWFCARQVIQRSDHGVVDNAALARDNVDQTVAALVASQVGPVRTSDVHDGMNARLAKAEQRLRRLQAAIEAGVDPAAVVDGINEAQAERAAARAMLDNAPVSSVLTGAEIYAMIDSLGDVAAALAEAKPRSLSRPTGS